MRTARANLENDETEGKRAKQSVWRRKMSDKKKTTRALVAEKLEVPNVTKTKAGLEDTIRNALNCASRENASDTPDFVLAQYLMDCLKAFEAATTARERWYGRLPSGQPESPFGGGARG
jgi:hypothetical protein